MLGISATLNEAVFGYLCIHICVFARQTLGNIAMGHMPSENMWFVWFDIPYSGQKVKSLEGILTHQSHISKVG